MTPAIAEQFIATLLERAAEAAFNRDRSRHFNAVIAAADCYEALWHRRPEVVPGVTAALLQRTSITRPDIRAALHELQRRYQQHAPLVLFIESDEIINAVSIEHDVDIDVLAAACTVRWTADRPSRDGLPIGPELTALLDKVTYNTLGAAAAVSHRVGPLIEANRVRAWRLHELVHPHLNNAESMSMAEATELLDGSDRIEAEELLALLPSVVVTNK